jgi:rhodanese-related sulfurtransferase
MKISKLFKVAIASLILAVGVNAAEEMTPDIAHAKKMGMKPVSLEEAKKMYDQKIIFVDTRTKMKFAEGHIKGAIFSDYVHGKDNKKVDGDLALDKYDLTDLPKDKSTKIVFYCQGAGCWKSFSYARAAEKAGYKNSYWFRDGLPAWQKAGYPVE